MRMERIWLWAFQSAENDVLVVITDSKERDVVEGTLRKISIPRS